MPEFVCLVVAAGFAYLPVAAGVECLTVPEFVCLVVAAGFAYLAVAAGFLYIYIYVYFLLQGLSAFLFLQGIPSWRGDRKGSNMDVQAGPCQSGLPLLSLLILLRERDGFLDEVVKAGDAES